MITDKSRTTTDSARTNNGHIQTITQDSEANDGKQTSHLSIRMHCKDMDLSQKTEKLWIDGRDLKVKTIRAFDENGNSVELRIMFDA